MFERTRRNCAVPLSSCDPNRARLDNILIPKRNQTRSAGAAVEAIFEPLLAGHPRTRSTAGMIEVAPNAGRGTRRKRPKLSLLYRFAASTWTGRSDALRTLRSF